LLYTLSLHDALPIYQVLHLPFLVQLVRQVHRVHLALPLQFLDHQVRVVQEVHQVHLVHQVHKDQMMQHQSITSKMAQVLLAEQFKQD
jgi:hypothetical protein